MNIKLILDTEVPSHITSVELYNATTNETIGRVLIKAGDDGVSVDVQDCDYATVVETFATYGELEQ